MLLTGSKKWVPSPEKVSVRTVAHVIPNFRLDGSQPMFLFFED